MMTYAQIKNGIVQNVIAVDAKTDLSLFANGLDAFLRVDVLPVIPGPGWLYDGKAFTDPRPTQAPDPDDAAKIARMVQMKALKDKGDSLNTQDIKDAIKLILQQMG